jgi:competence protein ComEA
MFATLRANLTALTQPQKKLAIVAAGVLAVLCYAAGSLGSGGGSAGSRGVATFAANAKPTGADAKIAVSLPQIYVALAGAVKRPGVYQLKSGARVFDAVFAAGGLTAKADQTSVNLARVVTDGEQIVVGKIGLGGSGSADGSGFGSGFGSGSTSSLISLNQASETELEALPGVGPALAGRMVDWRTANGGFRSKQDLLNVTGIGDKLFAAISKLVTL